MSVPGAPVQAPGWYPDPTGQARLRFWDGEHWTAMTTNAKDPDSARPLLGNGFAHLADWVGRLLALNAFLDVVVIGASIWIYSLLSSVGDLSALFVQDSPALTPTLSHQLSTAFLVWLGAVLLTSLGRLATGILWWVWQYRLAVAAPHSLRRSPVMHLLAWLIPFVNWWWPYQDMNDLWRAYGRSNKEVVQPSPGVFMGWWFTYLGGGFLAGLLLGLSVASTPQKQLAALAGFYVFFFGTQAAAAAMGRLVVRKLSWRALVYYAS